MNGLNTLFTLIALAVMVGVWVVQARISNSVMEQVEASKVSIQGDRDWNATELTVENAPGGELTVLKEAGRRSPRDEIVALVNPEHFSSERTIRLSQIVDPNALRKEDEVIPEDPKLRELWMTVRARAYSAVLCEDLVREFARACRPSGETIKGPSEAGHYVITSTLSYQPVAAFGDVPATETVSFGDFDVEPEEIEIDHYEPGAMVSHHRELLDLVEEACAEIRAVYGNCGPLGLTARFNLDRGRGLRDGWCRTPRDEVDTCALPRFRAQDFWLPRTAGEVELSVEVGYLQPPVEVAEGAVAPE